MNQKATILIVEDDRQIRRIIRNILVPLKYNILEAATAKAALSIEAAERPDLLLLDLGLPDGDGLSVIQQIRKERMTPIIVVSARDREKDKVKALDLGADDYITKPIGVDELPARIRTLLRRVRFVPSSHGSRYACDGLIVDIESRTVTLDGKNIHLTQTEFNILQCLCRNSGKVLTYDFIMAETWGDSADYDPQILRVNMANIRRKIERDPVVPEFIKTEVGVGYRIVGMELF